MAKAQFDRSEVIDKSIRLFWQNGFSASSMQQVVKATGLKPGSIYLAFGNKEGLFREALDGYAQKSLALIGDKLERAPNVGAGICALLKRFVEESTRADYCSCFLVKTQLELAAEGGELQAFAAAKLGEIEALFRGSLEKEFNSALSRRRATSLMLHIFGVRVYGYRRGAAGPMLHGLKEGLPWLPWTNDGSFSG